MYIGLLRISDFESQKLQLTLHLNHAQGKGRSDTSIGNATDKA